MKQNELDLLHRYLDGAITPDELDSLEDLLRNSVEARATLRSLVTIDAKWQQLAADEVIVIPDAREAAPRRSGRLISKWMTLGAVAASLLVGALGWLRAPEERAVDTKRGIARVIRIDGEGTAGQDRVVAHGAELFTGEELAMTQGLIELAFRETGVHVVATAPLRMTLSSDQRVLLDEGQIKLVVPPQGVGFVVETGQREFIDLGTSFVVTANSNGSEVLVLDGQISVGRHAGDPEDLMREGEFARFDQTGTLKTRSKNRLSRTVPELSLPVTKLDANSLRGTILGYSVPPAIPRITLYDDVIGRKLLPLIRSGFQDRACLDVFKRGEAISFRGISGAYRELPDRTGLAPYSRESGWMAWYRGNVIPPRPGRYRFWGYADNHLLVAIDGKPVFEGSRNNSSFKKLGIPRADNPALPCLIARAGFARGQWFELSDNPVRLDILFGEIGGDITSGLLLVEREGDTYEETFWGQPKWPLLLTETPGEDECAEFERLVNYLEEKTMGSFSISEDAVWRVSR